MDTDIIISNQDAHALWEFQDWDTEESYNAFSSFYLTLKPPRTLRKAFEKYTVSKKDLSTAEVRRIPMTPEFMMWANALDAHGERIADSLTWFERAVLYDDERFQNWQKQSKGNQIEVVLKETGDIQKVLAHWTYLYKEFDSWAKFRRNEAMNLGVAYNVSEEVNRLNDLLNIREKIAIFERRAVGLNSKDNAAGANKQDPSGFILWNEPEQIGDS